MKDAFILISVIMSLFHIFWLFMYGKVYFEPFNLKRMYRLGELRFSISVYLYTLATIVSIVLAIILEPTESSSYILIITK